MSKTFLDKRINELRQRASKVARPPKGYLKGLSISTFDPMAVQAVIKPLRIEEGFVLPA